MLGEIDREYTLFEIAIITSAGPARALGLSQKGHLGVGADADVTIYPAKARTTSMLFTYPRYVLKGGEIVVEEGEIRAVSEGREFIFRPAYDEQIEEYIRPLFQKVYTISFENYPVEIERVRGAEVVDKVEAVFRPAMNRMITLTLKEQPNVPLEAESLSPDVTATLSHDAIRALPVHLGKRQRRLDDFFTVEGEASDEIEIQR